MTPQRRDPRALGAPAFIITCSAGAGAAKSAWPPSLGARRNLQTAHAQGFTISSASRGMASKVHQFVDAVKRSLEEGKPINGYDMLNIILLYVVRKLNIVF